MSTEPERKHETTETSTASHKGDDHAELEEYAGGYIQAHHGTIAPWLLVVYAVLFIWALYYMVYYWGGLGPGLNY